MALKETERKFLVKGSFKEYAFHSVPVKQGYLCSDPDRTVRVRLYGGQGFITVKGRGDDAGVTRFEWEKEIPADEAEALLALAEPGIIDKTRYLIHNTDGIHVWEVDEFHGANSGLILAEIELSDCNEPFDRPSWLGAEVTGDSRYYNSSLSKK